MVRISLQVEVELNFQSLLKSWRPLTATDTIITPPVGSTTGYQKSNGKSPYSSFIETCAFQNLLFPTKKQFDASH
jgi:hypothetical protein